MSKQKIIKPHEGFQEKFVASNLDVVFAGGAAAGGKTAGSVLASGYYVDNPSYRALYIRKNLSELTAGGGMLDEFQNLYPKELFKSITTSDSPEIEFKGGLRIVMTHLADDNIERLKERTKGWQYDAIFMDELTAYSFSAFTYLLSRNRGSSGEKSIFRCTTNPKKSCWVRKFIDWYVDADGYIDPERDGVVRYFFNSGTSVDDVVWGNTKEEVYNLCKHQIDRVIKEAEKAGIEISFENAIKSFTFYKGSIFDNKTQIERDPDYIGSLMATGAVSSEQLLGGNWNIDEDEEQEVPIGTNKALSIFDNEPNTNGKYYIVVDVAGEGENNFVATVWHGFHIIDLMSLTQSSSPDVLRSIRLLQEKYNIGDSNIVFDAVSIGDYIRGFIPAAIAYKGNMSPLSNGRQRYARLKDQCADKLIQMVNDRAISISENVYKRIYKDVTLKKTTTIKEEIVNEFGVLRWDKPTSTGKKQLLNKKQMGRMLRKGGSTDILDNMIMRMYPDLNYQHYTEKELGITQKRYDDQDDYIELEDFLN